MKVQQIAKTSMITRTNTQGNLVSFSGNKANYTKNSMPSFGAKAPNPVAGKEKTLFEEIGDLVKTVVNSVKKSYKKSEIKKIFADPAARKWNKFANKSPKLAQAVKGAALLAAGVGAYEIIANKQRSDN